MNIATSHNPATISQSLARIELNKANDLYDDFAQHFWPMIGTANQAAYLAMDEAVEAMKECGMYKQQAKVKAQRAIDEFHKYEKLCTHHFLSMGDDRYYLWQDLIGRAADKLEPDVQKIFFAIKNVLDKYNVPNAVCYAKIQTAMALVTLSTLMFDTMAERYQRQTPVRIAEYFKAGRLTGSENNWKALGDITGKQVLQDINLRDDPACQLGVQVILTRYQSADFLNEAAGEALSLNPEINEKYK